MENKIGLGIRNIIETQVYPHIPVDDKNKLGRIIQSLFSD